MGEVAVKLRAIAPYLVVAVAAFIGISQAAENFGVAVMCIAYLSLFREYVAKRP